MVDVVECDAQRLLARAGPWLEGDPILHNVVCTVARWAAAAPTPQADALWFVMELGGEPVGAAILTPPHPLGLTPMPDDAITALADALADRRPTLSYVSGPGDVAGRFAEQWRRRTGACVEPGMEQLMYRLDAVVPPSGVDGTLRPAQVDDRDLLCEWFAAFSREAGATMGDPAAAVARRLADGSLRVWDHAGPRTMAGVSSAVAGVVRIGPVYTPPEMRRRGYASACVAAASREALDAGAAACMLYTDRANPTSNAIYQRIGFSCVGVASERRFRYA